LPDMNSLLPALYDELREIAAAHLRRERPGHTLQATALVHEAYRKLADGPASQWPSRAAFRAAAVQAIRRILVDHARARARQKRGGQSHQIELDAADLLATSPSVELLDLDAALAELERSEPRAARVVELRFFGGMSIPEVAEQLGFTTEDVLREWRYARAWLQDRLGKGGPAPPTERHGDES